MKKRHIRNIILFAIVCVLVSVIVLAILMGTGVFYYDGGFHFSQEIFASVKNSFWIYPVFIGLQTLLTTLLCFVPGTSAAMIGVAVALFGAGWKSFVVSAIGVYLSSFMMYALGRFGGNRIRLKLVGEDDLEKAEKFINEHGKIYFPLALACAGFPDDALVCVAGASRMNFLFFLLSVVFGRGIGIATICFGVKLLPQITCLWDLIVVATVCCFWLLVVFYLAHKLNVWINNRRDKHGNNVK